MAQNVQVRKPPQHVCSREDTVSFMNMQMCLKENVSRLSHFVILGLFSFLLILPTCGFRADLVRNVNPSSFWTFKKSSSPKRSFEIGPVLFAPCSGYTNTPSPPPRLCARSGLFQHFFSNNSRINKDKHLQLLVRHLRQTHWPAACFPPRSGSRGQAAAAAKGGRKREASPPAVRTRGGQKSEEPPSKRAKRWGLWQPWTRLPLQCFSRSIFKCLGGGGVWVRGASAAR